MRRRWRAIRCTRTWDTTNLSPAAYDNNTINEDIYSAYVQAKFDGEIGGLVTQTVVGLRYEQTEVEAEAQQNIVDRFLWTSDNDFQRVFGTDLAALGDKADYNNFLPNIDFSVALNDTMKVRASVSQTIARPQYNNLFMTTAVNGPGTLTMLGGFPTASRGNASLATARVDQPRCLIRVVLQRRQLRVDRLLQEGGQQLRRYRSHDHAAVRTYRTRAPARLAL